MSTMVAIGRYEQHGESGTKRELSVLPVLRIGFRVDPGLNERRSARASEANLRNPHSIHKMPENLVSHAASPLCVQIMPSADAKRESASLLLGGVVAMRFGINRTVDILQVQLFTAFSINAQTHRLIGIGSPVADLSREICARSGVS